MTATPVKWRVQAFRPVHNELLIHNENTQQMARQTHIRFNKPEPGVMMKYYLDYVRGIIDGRHVPDLDVSYRKPVRKLPASANDVSSDDTTGESAQTAGDGGDDGDGDGDGDPDSDRPSPPAPSASPQHRPLPQAPATLPRSFPPQLQHPELPKPSPSPKRSRRAPYRIPNDTPPEHWHYLTRGQWLSFALILIFLAVAATFALLDKDWLAWGVLTTTIPWIVTGFPRQPRE